MFGDTRVVFDYYTPPRVYRDKQLLHTMKHVYGYCDSVPGMLIMIVGINYIFSTQCVQLLNNRIYFRTNDNRLVTVDTNDWKTEKIIEGITDVRDFKVEENGEITVLSLKGMLKRVKIDAPEPPLKSVQLTNGNSTTTHWTTFCRLGKHTCVAGHDSSSKLIVFVLVDASAAPSPQQLPVCVDNISNQYGTHA